MIGFGIDRGKVTVEFPGGVKVFLRPDEARGLGRLLRNFADTAEALSQVRIERKLSKGEHEVIEDHLRNDRRVQAIIAYREFTGLGLQDSKLAVDNMGVL